MPAHRPAILEFDTLDSTNSEAHRRAAAGERGPLWIRAGRQEAGRGRSGRAWSSPSGNLSATYLFEPGCQPACRHQLSFVAGLAGYDAVRPHIAPRAPLQLKWPNDLQIGSAKVGGILVECSSYDGADLAMIGIGINIAVAPVVEGREVARLADHGGTLTPADLLAGLADAMQLWLARWGGGEGFGEVRRAWLERAHRVGQPLSVTVTDTKRDGSFAGLDDDGAMRLDIGGEVLRVTHGDVQLRDTQLLDEQARPAV